MKYFYRAFQDRGEIKERGVPVDHRFVKFASRQVRLEKRTIMENSLSTSEHSCKTGVVAVDCMVE